MNGKYLLDTNIVIALFRPEAAVVERLGLASEVFLSSNVVGKLYYGSYKSGRMADNVTRLEEFVREMEVLCPDAVTAKFYGQMKQGLKVLGRPIPENDLWIAAIARQYQLTLVSRDQHFVQVQELSVEIW